MVAQLEQKHRGDGKDAVRYLAGREVDGYMGLYHSERYVREGDFGAEWPVEQEAHCMNELESERYLMVTGGLERPIFERIGSPSGDSFEQDGDPFEKTPHRINPYYRPSMDREASNERLALMERSAVRGWTQENTNNMVSQDYPEYKLLRDVFAEPPRGGPVPRKQLTLLKKELGRALSTLCKDESEVVRHSYGLGGGGEATPKRVGRRLGLKRKQVLEIREMALRKLQHPIRSDRLKQFIQHR